MIFQVGYYMINELILYLYEVDNSGTEPAYKFYRHTFKDKEEGSESLRFAPFQINHMSYYWLQVDDKLKSKLGLGFVVKRIEYDIDNRQIMVKIKKDTTQAIYVRELDKVLVYDLFEKK
jgi:hypothetical protein